MSPHAKDAQDPHELFDLYDAEGRALGVRKRRAEVHRDGDWHRSLHLWVVLAGEGLAPRVVLQRRSAGKDTWPGRVDVAVTGHFRAGETLPDALREAREELGLAVRPEELTYLGTRRRADVPGPGLRDNEHQEVYLVVRPLALEALEPDPAELDAVLGVEPEALEALFAGRAPAVAAWERAPGEAGRHDTVLRAAEFVPARDGYYLSTLRALRALLAPR